MTRITHCRRRLFSIVASAAAGVTVLLSGGGAVGAHAAAPPAMKILGVPSPAGLGVADQGSGTAQRRAAGDARPADNDGQCVFLMQAACTSSDPSVTVETYSNGDTTGCTFGGTIDWGDGSAPDAISSFAGGPNGTIFPLGNHTYATAGTYTITVTGQVLSGGCTFGAGTLQFTLGSLITSPADGAVIAMTDPGYLSPQPTDTQRTPASRMLTVTGVDDCGCAVTVNGTSATVSGTTWQAQIPASSPGPLTITAETTTGEQSTANITLIDLRVLDPAENATLPLTTEPAMPQLNANLEIAGLPADQDTTGIVFTWKLQMINRYVVPKNNWLDDVRTVATGTTTGTSAMWQLPADTPITGGWGRLTVQADIPGLTDGTAQSEPRWINIPGANPGKAAVTDYLTTSAPNHADALTHIACVESGRTFDQFRPTAQPLTITYRHQQITIPAKSDMIPDGWPNPAPLRPIFGYPSGIGIMQLDPASFPAQQWDWHSNVLGGIRLYDEKEKIAAEWPGHEQTVIDAARIHDLDIVNAARKAAGLPSTTVRRVKVDQYTKSQLSDDTIRGYNGYGTGSRYHQYTFDPRYAISADHLHVTINGMPDWVKTSIPARFNPDYVSNVWACT